MWERYFTVFLVLFTSLRATITAQDLDEYYKYEEAELKAKDPDYGVKWIYIPDGNGVPQRADLDQSMDISMRTTVDVPEVNYFLYTRENVNTPVKLKLPEDSEASQIPFGEKMFDPSKDTKLLIHGWKSSSKTPSVHELKDALLKQQDYNVIAVDWQEMADHTNYLVSVWYTKIVGKAIADILNYLMTHYNMKPEQFHLIGHSLGAHTAGYAGLFSEKKLGRITGLDPARPGFELLAVADDALDPSDAQFVDVIHTCAGILGYTAPLGHADFYPNGGTPPQPGCIKKVIKGIFTGILSACSHSRSFELFAESINDPQAFPAKKCPNKNESKLENCKGGVSYMGYKARPDLHGTFMLETSGDSPFGKTS